jgi:uncharacterized protein YqgV (UPF0045/DUF77 family)
MRITVDISMYPLTESYIEPIKKFIEAINSNPEIEVMTNKVSTQLRGEHSVIMPLITDEMVRVFDSIRASFVIKIIKGKD